MNKKSYSKDVDALLVEYLYESMFIPFPNKEIRFISYRKSENMTIVSVGIHKEFIDLTDLERKQLY